MMSDLDDDVEEEEERSSFSNSNESRLASDVAEDICRCVPNSDMISNESPFALLALLLLMLFAV